MLLTKPRIEPLDPDDLDDAAAEVLGPLSAGGNTLNIFSTLARHPDLFKRWMVFANHVMFKSTLPARDREMAILRVGLLLKSEYEWAQHVVIAKQVGISADEILRIAEGPGAQGWTGFESALLRAADELVRDGFVTDGTWSVLAEEYSTEQLMDLVFTIGQYALVSMALNTFGVQLDEGLEGFPNEA